METDLAKILFSNGLAAVAFFFLFAIFWLIMWNFSIGITSIIFGWRRLAAKYPYTETVGDLGTKFSFQSVNVSVFGYYGFFIYVTIYDAGIKIVPMLPYRFMHPPIFLKWSDITGIRYSKLISNMAFLKVGKKTIMIRGESAKYIRQLKKL
ncbi:MAG: hypothetical protein Q8P90_00050 [bacterium]|nr:hypothetical protein [bacterium]